MFGDGLEDYKEAILERLKSIERMFELSSIGLTDTKKLVQSGRDLDQVRLDMLKVRHGEISWDDLKKYNITKGQLEKITENRRQMESENRYHLSDFTALSEVPIKEYGERGDTHINELFSMAEFIYTHYMALFTQKILLYSSRNNAAREALYRNYQELERSFNHYISFSNSLNSRSDRLYRDDILAKEYTILFKKYYGFIVSLKTCVDGVQKDATITEADFSETISSVDPDMRIYGLSLKVALEECRNFINEVEEYMNIINRDFFDAVNIDNQKN